MLSASGEQTARAVTAAAGAGSSWACGARRKPSGMLASGRCCGGPGLSAWRAGARGGRHDRRDGDPAPAAGLPRGPVTRWRGRACSWGMSWTDARSLMMRSC